MKFHPSEGDRRLRTDLILDSLYYPTTCTPFHVNSTDSSQEQEQEGKEKIPALINQSIWTFLTEHQPEFAGPESESIKMNKMASLLPSGGGGESCYENGFWFPKTEPVFSNPFIQFIESDSNQDEQNNNNVSLKAHLLNISMKNPSYFHEEDEKENLAWISNIPNGISLNNLVMTRDKSPSIEPPSENLKSSSNYRNVCQQEDMVNQKEIASDSSSLDQYIQWKSKLSPWENNNNNNINPNQIENKMSLKSLSAQQQQHHLDRQRQQEQQQSALELELLEKLEPLMDEYNADDDDDDDDIVVVVQDGNSYNCYDDDEDEQEQQQEELDGEEDVSEKSDNADLVTFLSKFPAIAAIWGQESSNESVVPGNPWNTNNNNNETANRNFLPPSSIFDFQHIEDENKIIEAGKMMKNNNSNISSSTSRKYTIVNGVLQLGSSNNDYNHQQHHHNNSDHMDDQNSKLRLLNHSPSKSGFIKFIPFYSNQNESSKFQQQYDKYQQGGNKESSLKEMLNNLDLGGCDVEEQEIVQACSQPVDDANDDLLTSWKTHFRPVGALETQEEADQVVSPTSTLSQSQLPEFRTDYNENEYVLYKGSSSAFQLRFKLCSENEKGNQTEEISHLHQTSNISCNSDYQLGSLSTPLLTDYGSQYYDWLSGQQYDDGSQYMDSPYVINDYCCEEVYDDYEKFNNDNDSDYGQFQSFYYTNASSNLNNNNSSSNKQSKSSRRSAKAKGFKGRPCKYFFDGLCKMGNDCKFSHDLITCRFWAEGSCLKGPSCPFLHCFLDAKDFENHDEINSNYQQQFSLESESDFPALGGGSSKISSRVPIMSEDGSNVFSDDEGNPSMILNNNNNIKKSEEEEAGYSQPHHLNNNWISLISTEKRKKKK